MSNDISFEIYRPDKHTHNRTTALPGPLKLVHTITSVHAGDTHWNGSHADIVRHSLYCHVVNRRPQQVLSRLDPRFLRSRPEGVVATLTVGQCIFTSYIIDVLLQS